MENETKVNELGFHDEVVNSLLKVRLENLETDEVVKPSITPEKANSILWVISKLENEIEAKEDIYFSEYDRLTNWLEGEKEKRNKDIDYLTAVLEAFYDNNGFTKTESFPNGKLYKRKMPDRVEVDDAEAFEKWWNENGNDMEYMKITKKPILKNIKKYIQDAGECPNGVEYLVGGKCFKIKTEGVM